MDIEFIELEHRENVLKVMEICGVDLKEAYELYTASGYNFEAAVNRKFNPVQEQPFIPPQEPHQQYYPEEAFQGGPQGFNPGAFYDEEDIQYAQYKQFRISGKPFDRKYPIQPKQGFFKSLIPTFMRGTGEETFKGKLQRYLGRHINLKCDSGNLSQTFHWCWKQKFPLCAILLDFEQRSLPLIKRFFQDDLLVEKVISEQFKAYGINTKQYQLQNQLKNFFNFQRDANSIIICRVNHLDEIIIVTRISLNETSDDIRKKIKQAKSECIQKQLDESHIVRQYHQELRGNFNYQRPKTIKQSIKMREDKKIRKQQEEEFFKACQPKTKEEEKRPNIEQTKRQQSKPAPQQERKPFKEEIKPQRPPSPQKVPVISEEKVKQNRQEKFSKLKKYNSGIAFKIRLPSGSNLMVTVDPQEKIQYLFDFIECQPDDLGFNDEIERNFDFTIGFGANRTLKGNENKLIKDLFEDSEVLIIREL